MNNLTWATILRHIPEEKLHQFTIVTSGNIEITLQSLLRLETEFAVIKGRLSGSQDAGRVFFVPYCHMINLGTLNPLKDEEYEAMFSTLEIPTSAPVLAPITAVTPSSPILEPVTVAGANGFNGASKTDSGVRNSIRSEVLERFRSRPGAPASSANLPNPRQG